MGAISREFTHFNAQSHQMRTLLKTNMVYAFVLPVIELFVGAYIIRSGGQSSLVMVYQLAQGTGIPLTFLINGWLLRYFPVSRIYGAGMILSGLSMLAIMLLGELSIFGVAAAGLFMGLAYGFFWANRVSLALVSTTDANRNYYYGLEALFFTGASIAMPVLGGFLIAMASKGWFFGQVKYAYYFLTGIVLVLTLVASMIAAGGKFRQPPSGKFLYLQFHQLWRKMLLMASLKGVAQGFVIAAPVMLVMRLVGDEAEVGSVQSLGAGLSAVLLYVLGRSAGPKHRLKIYLLGLLLFFFGAVINTFLFSKIGAIVFVACLVFARPLMDLAYFPLQLGVIDCVAAREGRSHFSYLFSHEVGLYVGRVFGCLLFVFSAKFISEDWALRYALVMVAGVQLLSIFVAKWIQSDNEWCEAPSNAPLQAEALKEPAEIP
jgi:YQGE family putative transporter